MSDADVSAAVEAALCCDWEKARQINTKLLADNPTDIGCLNRLGRAYLELGDGKKAALYFKKVLKISKYDPIAQRNLAKALAFPANKKGVKPTITPTSQPMGAFIEEPGITKLITLVNIANPKILMTANFGDTVIIVTKKHTISLTDRENNYLGALPDDIAHRLLLLIKGGNTYEGYVKSVSKTGVSIFLKETFRAKKFRNTPSFVGGGSASDYLSFVREDGLPDEAAAVETPEEDKDDDTPARRRSSYDDEEVDSA